MTKKEMEEIFLELIEIISYKQIIFEEENLRQKMVKLKSYTNECDYLTELLEMMQDELCIGEYCNVEYCKEIINEIANGLELHSVIEKLEGHIMPEQDMVYCPECEKALHIKDGYYPCECGWTTNY